MDLQSRRCGCGALFKLATLRARETHCHSCQRTRASGLQAQAVSAGLLEPVLKQLPGRGRLVVDYQPVAKREPAQPVTREPMACAASGGFAAAARSTPDGWTFQRIGQAWLRSPPPKPTPGSARCVAPEPTGDRVDEAIKRMLDRREREHERELRERELAGRYDRLMSVGHVIQYGDKLIRVIADPNVPPGNVVMHWTDQRGTAQRATMPIGYPP